jgi:quercetin dioxygenase-like cupin family protein
MVNLDEVRFPAQEADTPPTMRIAVLEGAFPFGPAKAYTALIEFDPGVVVPPHTHPTTERIAVLAGAFSFGTGEHPDRSSAKPVAAGAVLITPAGTPHWGAIGDGKAMLFIHGVGPHNDPRAVDPAAAAPPAARYDPRVAAPVIANAAEVAFTPAPAGFPPGSSIAVLEGELLRSAAEHTVQLRLPAGARVAAHSHPTHERLVVLSGSVTVSAGNTRKEMRPGGFVLMPAGRVHSLASATGAVLQIQGLGPLRMDGAPPPPDDSP